MNSPFFSIILPTYNREKHLPKAIESVLSQEEESWELLVIDDGSTDNTRALVSAYPDLRICYHYQSNAERSAARNNGITKAKGEYICFLDSDDYYLPNHLRTFKEAILSSESPQATLFFIDIFFENRSKRTYFENPTISYRNNTEWMVQMPIGPFRTCLPAKVLKKYRFNPAFRVSEDTDLWTKIVRKCQVVHIPKATCVAVNHGSRTVSRRNTAAFRENLRVKKHILNREARYICPKIRRRVLHQAFLNLAMSHQTNRQWRAMLAALLRAFLYRPRYRWKEKIYMCTQIFSPKN